MIDYVNNFPIVPESPAETPRLSLKTYTSDAQFLMANQGDLRIPDFSKKFDPTEWVLTYPSEVIERDTYREYLANTNLMSSLQGGQEGFVDSIAEWFGFGPNEFQDYSRGAAMRSVIMGKNPLAVVKYGDSDLTPEKLDNARSLVKLLAPIADKEEQNPDALTPTQQRVQKAEELLQYALAKKTVKERLGFSTKEGLISQSTIFSTILGKSDLDIARSTDDILAIRNKVDPSFDPELWWNALDPRVKQGFIENNISPNLIYTATNEDEVNYRINEVLLKNNVQQRIEQYKPRWVDTGRLLADNLIGGVVNSPDNIPLMALELGLGAATFGLSLIPSVAIRAATTATRGLTAFRVARNITETIAKLPLSMAPSYAKNLGLLNSAVMTGTIFGVGNAMQETARQNKMIAYSAALNYADPESQKDLDIATIAWAGGEGFALGFLGFGLLPSITGSTAGAFLNRFKGVNIAPVGDAVVRLSSDKRFTYEGTRVGETMGYFNKKLTRKEVAVDLPVPEKVITESILEGVEPTPERIQAETTTARDRTDARAAVTPEAARATPDVPMTRRLDNETRQAYAERTGTNGTLSNIIEFVTELSRKNSAGDAVKERASITSTAETFGDMGTTDRLRILHAAEEHLVTTRLKEKEAGLLTPARDKIYATMETQRRGMIKNYTKSLSKPERKALSESLGGIKGPRKTITEHVADARSTVVTAAAKNEAAEKAAVSLLGTAREIVANPSKKAELTADLPKEVLDIVDSTVTELALTNTVSDSTVDAIKANIAGEAYTPVNRLHEDIKKALSLKRLDPKRTALIARLREDVSLFVSLVTGNKEHAQRFFDFTEDLVAKNIITKTDRELLLASVVHLNFDSKAFDIKYSVESFVSKDGKPQGIRLADFDSKKKIVRINSTSDNKSSNMRTLAVLHELGHAYFQAAATGDIYLNALKLYNNLIKDSKASTLLNIDVATLADPLLASGYLTSYHLQNMEETFVNTFSLVLFTEAEAYSVVAALKPVEVSLFKRVLKDLKESIIFAASVFNSSDHYTVASALIKKITELDTAANDAVSVPDLVSAMTTALKQNKFKRDLAPSLSIVQTDKGTRISNSISMVEASLNDQFGAVVGKLLGRGENKLAGGLVIASNASDLATKFKEKTGRDLDEDTLDSIKADKIKAEGTARAWMIFAENRKLVNFTQIRSVADARVQAQAHYEKLISTVPAFDPDAYINSITDLELENLPLTVRTSVAEYRKGNKDAALVSLLEDVTVARQNSIDRWKEGLEVTNPTFAADPFFRDYVVTTVMAQFKTDSANTGLPFNKAALDLVYAEIQSGLAPRFDVTYRKALLKLTEDLVEIGDADNGWRRIPMSNVADSDFDLRVNQLQSCSASGWCTQDYMAAPYIQDGDFWTYIHKGKPTVAVRLEDNNLSVGEMQGLANNGSVPIEHIDKINLLVNSGKLPTLDPSQIKAMQRANEVAIAEAAIKTAGGVQFKPTATFTQGRAGTPTAVKQLEIFAGTYAQASIKCFKMPDGSITLIGDGYLQLGDDLVSELINVTEIIGNFTIGTEQRVKGSPRKVNRLPNLRKVTGRLNINEDVDLPGLKTVTDGIQVNNYDIKINIDNLESLQGGLEFVEYQVNVKYGTRPVVSMAKLKLIEGNVDLVTNNNIKFNVPALKKIDGKLTVVKLGTYIASSPKDRITLEGLTEVTEVIQISNVNLPALIDHNGPLYLQENCSLPNLIGVDDLKLHAKTEADTLPNLRTIYDKFDYLIDVSLPQLETIGGDVIAFANLDASLDLPNLTSIGGSIEFNNNGSSYKLPSLNRVDGVVTINTDKAELPSLYSVGYLNVKHTTSMGDTFINGYRQSGAPVITLPNLGKVYHNCTFETPVSAPILKRVDGSLFITGKCLAPKLEIVNGDVTIKGKVDLSSLRLVGKNLHNFNMDTSLYALREVQGNLNLGPDHKLYKFPGISEGLKVGGDVLISKYTVDKHGVSAWDYMMVEVADAKLLGYRGIENRADLGDSFIRYSANGEVAGLYDPKSGLMFLVASALTDGTAPSVLAHEVMHGVATKAMEARALDLVNSRADTTATPEFQSFMAKVYDRMAKANVTDNPAEAIGYIVEEAMLAGRTNGFSVIDNTFIAKIVDLFGEKIGSIIRDVVASVRARLYKNGMNMTLSVDDMLAFAKNGLHTLADGETAPVKDTTVKASKIANDNESINNFNNTVTQWLKSNTSQAQPNINPKNFRFTQGEIDLISNGLGDPSMIIAMAIVKSSGNEVINSDGKLTVHMKTLVDAYNSHKQAQFNSMLVKVTWLLTTQEFKQMAGMNLQERQTFIQTKLFDAKKFKTGDTEKTLLPATYQERDIADVYDVSYWGTTADSLINLLESGLETQTSSATKAKNKLKTPTDVLSVDDINTLLSEVHGNKFLTATLIETLREHLNNNGLSDIAELVVMQHHKAYIKSLQSQGVFNIDEPTWSSQNIALDSISAFLSDKNSTHLALPILNKNIDPVLIKKLSERPNMTPEKVLVGVHKMIKDGSIVLNDITGKWEIPREKTPSATTTTVAMADAAEADAIADGSQVLTIDNLNDIVAKLFEKKLITGLQASIIFEKLEYIHEKIKDGTLTTENKLIRLAATMRRNEFLDEKRSKDGTAEDLVTKTGTEKGRKKGPSMVDLRSGKLKKTTLKEFKKTRYHAAIIWNNLSNNALFTEEEVSLVRGLLAFQSDAALAKNSEEFLGKKVSARTIGTRRNELIEKFDSIGKAINYSPDDTPQSIQLKLARYIKTLDNAIAETTTKPMKTKEVIADIAKTPVTPTVSNPVDTGSRLLEKQALAAKLVNKNPDPVITPSTKVEEGTLFRATSEATGGQPEAVLRPEKQVDAIIENSEVSTKEAVSFVPKKPLVMTMTAAEFMANPIKVASTLKVADRMGVDALVFSDGVVMPTKVDAPVVIGKVETNVKPGVESVTTLTVTKGVPTKRVREKKPRVAAKPIAEKAVEATTVTEVAPPSAPVVAPEESIGIVRDGAPVRVTKTGGIEGPTPVKTVSEVVKTTETERIERIVNDDKDLLRDNGMDQGFLKLFLKNYWTRMQNIDLSRDTYSPTLLSLWTKFVTINKAIVEANRAVFGDDGVAKFWITVDKLRAENIKKLATVPGYKSISERQLMVLAAKEVGDAYMPPILLDELNIVNTAEGTFTLTAKETKTSRKKVSDATKDESPVPVPPEPTPVPAPKAGEEVAEVIPLEPVRETPRADVGPLIKQGTTNSEENASVLLRQSSLIGAIFGGSERASRNWWRALASWMANATQSASKTGETIRNLQKNIRFLARLFEDNRAQTGHLTAAGKEAFRTARQCKSDEARLITRIARQQLLVNKKLKDSGLAADKIRAVGILSYTKLSEGVNVSPADLVALGLSPELAKEVATETNVLLKVLRQTNQTILELQADTGLGHVTSHDGTPLDPMKYAPIQLNHETFGAMSPTERATFVAALVKSRRARKLKSPVLDINTLIVLGWLDVAPSKEARGTVLFAGDREFRAGDSTNSLSPETLAGLKEAEYPITIGEQKILEQLANKADSHNFFMLKANGVSTLYRMPKVINDLSKADQLRYVEAVGGNKALYTQRWQDYLKGKDLIEAEMDEMLDFKTKKGAYSEYNRKTGTNIDRPLMRVGQEEQKALSIPGIIPEEVLADPIILKHIRTNLAEAYNYFLNGRAFELIFQKELDRLLGTRGVTMIDIFQHVGVQAREDLEAIAVAENWSKGQTEARLADIDAGMTRLREEYMYNADTLPMLPYQDQYAARISLALMKTKIAPGYFFGALPELIMETLKANPLALPKTLIQNLRYLAGDLRFSKNALMNNSELGDMIFGLENIKHDFSSRFLGEAGQGAFELDSKLKTKFVNSNPSRGVIDTGIRGLETVSKVAESIGSLQAITNMTRAMAKTRVQRMLYKHIKKGRIQKLLTALEDPKLMKIMQDYMIAAETDAAAERKLWKQFSTIARQYGFGFNPQEALVFLKYGLNSVEKIKHLEYLIKGTDPKGDGRVNIHDMVDMYWQAKNKPVDGIKPEVLEQVISSYAHTLEDLVVKTSSPEPTGLGKVTTIDSKTALGKLWYALGSYLRGFQDSVILDYGSRSTLHYLAANMVLYGTIDTLIGLFREWIAGREGEDIVEEFSENPSAFAVRVAKSAPILGTSQAALEAVLSGFSYMAGGTWRSYGTPMESIGIGAAASAAEDIYRGTKSIAEQATAEQTDYTKVAKGVGDIVAVNSLLNRSPFAVAARSLEASGTLDQKGALQSYLDAIQREPYPYAKLQRQQQRNPTPSALPPTQPRNFMLEEQAIEKARLKQAGKPYSGDMSKGIAGVSGSLGDLLGNAQ